MADIQQLNTTGFTFTSLKWEAPPMLKADYGNGLEEVAIVGETDGLHYWSMKIEVLPDDQTYGLINDTQFTRAAYLWKFYKASKQAGNMPFWFKCWHPGEVGEQDWLCCFADDEITFEILCGRIFGGVGLTLRERRLRDQESPGDAVPSENPDQI